MAATAAGSDAREILTSALQCFPEDGNLWLRLAMVEFATTASIPSAGQNGQAVGRGRAARRLDLEAAACVHGAPGGDRPLCCRRTCWLTTSAVSHATRAFPTSWPCSVKLTPPRGTCFSPGFPKLSDKRRNEIVAGINAR